METARRKVVPKQLIDGERHFRYVAEDSADKPLPRPWRRSGTIAQTSARITSTFR